MNLLDPRTRAIRFLRALSGEIPDAGTGAMTNEIDRGQCKAAADELERDDARVERSPDIVLTGGNHLANVLVHSLGPGFSEHFPPTMASEAVLEALGACDTYDVWCCWAAIMRWRDGVLRRIDEGTITEVAPIKQEAWDALAGSASNERFQSRVAPWMQACFGPEISADIPERNHRFIEESLELVQAGGATRSECHQLVDYVYGRPAGEPGQEVGGVMVTLAALCLARGIDMHECGERELARVWTCVEKIRAKQAAKPKHSPLPEHVEPPVGAFPDAIAIEMMRGLLQSARCPDKNCDNKGTIATYDSRGDVEPQQCEWCHYRDRSVALDAATEDRVPKMGEQDAEIERLHGALAAAEKWCRYAHGKPLSDLAFSATGIASPEDARTIAAGVAASVEQPKGLIP